MNIDASTIQKQIFDVNYNNEANAPVLQDKLIRICNTGLTAALEKIVEKHFSYDTAEIVNLLEIDIGVISYEDLEGEIVQKVCEKFEAGLLRIKKDNYASPLTLNPGETPAKQARIKLLEYYLQFGILPWWAGEMPAKGIEAEFNAQVLSNAAQARNMLLRLGSKQFVVKRIAAQFSLKTLYNIVELIETSNSHIIIAYSEELDKKQRIGEIVKTGTAEFKVAKWVFILNYLFENAGSYFNKKEFIKSIIAQIAAHYNVNFLGLLSNLANILPSQKGLADKYSFLLLIRDIYDDEVSTPERISPDSNIENSVKHVKQPGEPGKIITGYYSDVVLYTLANASLPWQYAFLPRKSFEQMFRAYITHYGWAKVFQIIKEHGLEHTSIKIISGYFKEELIREIIEKAEPANARFIISIVEGLQNNYRQSELSAIIPARFKKVMYEGIIFILLTAQSNIFNKEYFVSKVIYRIAAGLNVSKGQWPERMIKAVVEAANLLPGNTVSAHFYELARQAKTSAGIMISHEPALGDTDRLARLQDELFYFIVTGKSSVNAGNYNINSFADVVKLLLRHKHDSFLQQLTELSGSIKIMQRLAVIIDTEILFKIISYTTNVVLLPFETGETNVLLSKGKISVAIKSFLLTWFFRVKISNQPISFFEATTLLKAITIDAPAQRKNVLNAMDALFQPVNNNLYTKDFLLTIEQIKNEGLDVKIVNTLSDKPLTETTDTLQWSAMEFYIARGFLPWWHAGFSPKALQSLFRKKLKQNKDFVISRIIAIAANSGALSRIMDILQKKDYALVIKTISPSPAQHILKQIEILETRKPDDKLTQSLKLAVLIFFINQKQHPRKDSVLLLSEALHAAANGVMPVFEKIRSALFQISVSAKQTRERNIFFDAVIFLADKPQIIDVENKKNKQEDISTINSKALTYYLQHLELPANIATVSIVDFFKVLVQHYSSESRAILTYFLRSATARKNLVRHAGDKALEIVLKLIIGNKHELLSDTISETDRLFKENDLVNRAFADDIFWERKLEYFFTNRDISATGYTSFILKAYYSATGEREGDVLKKASAIVNKKYNEFGAILRVIINIENDKIRELAFEAKPQPQKDAGVESSVPLEVNIAQQGFEHTERGQALIYYLQYQKLPVAFTGMPIKSLFKTIADSNAAEVRNILIRLLKRGDIRKNLARNTTGGILSFIIKIIAGTADAYLDEVVTKIGFLFKEQALANSAFANTVFWEQTLEYLSMNRIVSVTAYVNFILKSYYIKTLKREEDVLKKAVSAIAKKPGFFGETLRAIVVFDFEKLKGHSVEKSNKKQPVQLDDIYLHPASEPYAKDNTLASLDNIEALKFYLQYQRLPERFEHISLIDFFKAAIKNYPAEAQAVLSKLLKSNVIRKNIVAHTEDGVLFIILKLIMGKSSRYLIDVVATSGLLFKENIFNSNVFTRAFLWQQKLEYFSMAREVSAYGYISFMLKTYFSLTGAKQEEILYKAATIVNKAPQKFGAALSAIINIENEKFQKAKWQDAKRRGDEKQEEPGVELETPSEIYIHNAGLILVWPFIPALFAKAGLVNDNGFISPLHANKAVYLLEYLVTGIEEMHEYNLSLNKILCGLSIAEPIIKDVSLTDDDKEIVEGLLTSIISQWAAVGNTSAEGLRGSFFIRKGKLTIAETSFNLVVDKMSFDILVDHLPWAIGVIKLSWMAKTLFVKWR